MKALSILQPWAWLIVRPDLPLGPAREDAARRGLIKDIENRRWSSRYRGRFLVHAGKKWGPEQREDLAAVRDLFPGIALPAPADFQRGGIVGVATLVDVCSDSDSPWFFGPFGFRLEDQAPLPFLPYKGALGFFDVPDHLLDRRDPR